MDLKMLVLFGLSLVLGVCVCEEKLLLVTVATEVNIRSISVNIFDLI